MKRISMLMAVLSVCFLATSCATWHKMCQPKPNESSSQATAQAANQAPVVTDTLDIAEPLGKAYILNPKGITESFHLNGKTKVIFSLPSNETTGYSWFINTNNPAVRVSMSYVPDIRLKGFVGQPGHENFVIRLPSDLKNNVMLTLVYIGFSGVPVRHQVNLLVS